MSRFEQRRQRRLLNADVRAGYQETAAEFALLNALDRAREAIGLNQADLADILGRSQPAVSQFFSGSYAITLDAFVEYLEALRLQARVEIVPAVEDEPALIVEEHTASL
jgi:transcriptional regulator with XRE-family HTH domain